MKEPIIIKRNFFKQLSLVFLCILLIVASVFVVYTYRYSSLLLFLIGIFSCLFFGLAMVVLIKNLIIPKPLLIIDSTGFTDNSTAVSTGQKIYWSQVIDINLDSLYNQKLIYVDVSNPDEVLDSFNPIKKAVAEVNTAISSSVIQIALNYSADMNCEEAYNIMRRYWIDYKKSTQNHDASES